MRVTFKPMTFGIKKSPGWLVMFNGSLVASLYSWETGEYGLQWGYETPWICASTTWPNFEAAKAEFEYYAKLYSDGLTPQQLGWMIEDQTNPPANDAEKRSRAAWRKLSAKPS